MQNIGYQYDKKFYSEQKANNLSSAKVIVPIVIDLVKKAKKTEEISVIDLGCGTANWLSVFQENGCEVTGVDGGGNLDELLMIPKENFIQHDFREPLSLDKKYSLSMSLEVAEHIPESKADQFIDELVALSDIVLFSAAIPHQRGAGHINEQYPAYWIEKFRKRGYGVADCIRKKVWNNKEVRGFYAQNIFLYYKLERQFLNLQELSRHNEDTMLNLVHPEVWEELNNYHFMKVIDKLHDNPIIYSIYTRLKK